MPSEYTWHVPRVHKRVLKLVNFEDQKVQKPELFDLAATFPCLRGDHWDMSHTPGPILQLNKRQVGFSGF